MPEIDRDELRQAGYQEGDFLPVVGFGPFKLDQSFTNTSYDHVRNLLTTRLRWDELPIPDGASTQVFLQCQVNPGSEETVSVRVYNPTDSETVAEETGLSTSFEMVTLGPVDYTPTTTSSDLTLQPEVKTDAGSSSCEIVTPYLGVGVKI